MKIDERTRFPHPVLNADTGDYQSGSFSLKITGVAEGLTTDQVVVDYTVALDEPTLLTAVQDGRAVAGIFVTCLDTYLSILVPLGLAAGRFAFEPGALVGRVEIRPIIWARNAITDFPTLHAHPEFGGQPIALDAGAILAFDDLTVLNIGREKLAQMDTIFSIVEDPELPNDELSVNLEAERIQVLVATNIHQGLNSLRTRGYGRSIILNSVFLPAVMEVLDTLRVGGDTYEGRRWFRVFSAKCDHLGIDLRQPDLWKDAQLLLRDPFSEIRKSPEIWEA